MPATDAPALNPHVSTGGEAIHVSTDLWIRPDTQINLSTLTSFSATPVLAIGRPGGQVSLYFMGDRTTPAIDVLDNFVNFLVTWRDAIVARSDDWDK